MPVPSMATTADLEAWRDGDQDVALDAAQAIVRAYCGWHIAPVITETVVLNPSRGYSLFLPTKYVVSVNAVSVDGVAAVLGADDVEWDGTGALYRRLGWWGVSGPLRSVSVTFTHGYTEVPVDVRTAVLDLAGSVQRDTSVTRMQVGQVSRQYAEEHVTGLHQMLLAPYRVTAIA